MSRDSFAKKILFTAVSFSNSQNLISRFLHPRRFLPKIVLARYHKGAGIDVSEARTILDGIPSLASKPWTEFWIREGRRFLEHKQYQKACMSFVMGTFPKEDNAWKHEINELKRESFKQWCVEGGIPFEERHLTCKYGQVRYYLLRPLLQEGQKAAVTLFINGLEGSAEEFAFPLLPHIKQGMGFATLSIPGSADYSEGMNADSDLLLKAVIDDLEKEHWIDSRRIGMVGFSFGAYWTLICAKTDPRIRFAVCNGLPLHHTLAAGAGFGLNPVISYALLKLFRLFHPFQLLPIVNRLHRRAIALLAEPSGPILFMNGDSDSIVDARDTVMAAASSGNHQVLLFKNDEHCGLYHYERMVKVIVSWIRRCLDPDRRRIVAP